MKYQKNSNIVKRALIYGVMVKRRSVKEVLILEYFSFPLSSVM
jgi:hypothetical protein